MEDFVLEVKMLIVDICSAIGFPQVGLGFTDPRVRRLAIRRMENPRHIGRLIRVILEDPVPRVREEAICTIEETGVYTLELINALKQAINDPDDWVRRSARRVLRRAGQLESTV